MQNLQSNTPRVALVTGAARRIGAEIARTLHRAGMNVVLHYHTSKQEAESLVKQLNAIRPHSAASVSADLSQIASLPEVIQQAVACWGRLDALVNNASRFYRTKIGETTEAAWDDLMASNLKYCYFLAQAAIPALASTQGCIINLADVHGERPMRDYSVYCISKAGLIMLTKSLSKELGRKNIRVNAIAPGEVLWPEGENTMSKEEKQNVLDRVALRRKGEPEEVAKAVLFLVTNADYITGHVLTVDGGRSLKI